MLEKTGVHEVGVFGKWAKNLGIWASFHLNLSYLNISCKKSYCNSYLCLLVFHLPHYLPLLPLRLFPLLFIFCSLNMMYLKHGFVFVHCVVYFHGYFFCFVLHMYPELLRSVYAINLGKSLAISTSSISPLLFFFSPSGIKTVCMVYLLILFHSS